MRYLFDTHIIIWALTNDKHLSKEIKKIIIDDSNEIYYSTASTWEIEIKHLKRKDFKLSGEQFSFLCNQNGLLNIQIMNKHINELENIKDENIEHKDPFDKILLCQAISEHLMFVTHDNRFKKYNNKNIMIV